MKSALFVGLLGLLMVVAGCGFSTTETVTIAGGSDAGNDAGNDASPESADASSESTDKSSDSTPANQDADGGQDATNDEDNSPAEQTDESEAGPPDTDQTADDPLADPGGADQDQEQTQPVPIAAGRVTPAALQQKKRRRPGQIEDVTFDDLKLEMKADSVFQPSMLTDKVKDLDKQKIRIKGFIFPSYKQSGITEFPFIANPECKFGPGGLAYCIIRVQLKKGLSTEFTTKAVTVEGNFEIRPWKGPDGNTWMLYYMTGEKIY